jgi:Holliday junction DNA helicase RuvA
MIGTLRGNVSIIDEDGLVLEVQGVGYHVNVPTPFKNQVILGDNIYLFTRLIVREDSLTLYGFEDNESREVFDLLLGVNGVGPRLALSVLSTLDTDVIRRAIFNEQVDVFSQVPGIGKKTAQKILFHLQDRISSIDELAPVAGYSSMDNELLEALTSLGYSVVEAQAAIQSVPRDAPTNLENKLVLALQYFGGK